MGLFGKKLAAKKIDVRKLSAEEVRGVELALDLARASLLREGKPDKKMMKILDTAQADFKDRRITEEDLNFILSSLAVAINGGYAIVTEEKKAAMEMAMDDLTEMGEGGGSGDAGDIAVNAMR